MRDCPGAVMLKRGREGISVITAAVRRRRAYFFILLLAGSFGISELTAAPSQNVLDTTTGNPQFYLRPTAYTEPNYDTATHNIGKISEQLSNDGTFGGSYDGGEFPINSGLHYTRQVQLWIGGMSRGNILVSENSNYDAGMLLYKGELNPETGEAAKFIRRSTLPNKPEYDPNAVSEQDFICTYTDTLVQTNITGCNPFDNRPHIPLGLSVRQSSYAWSSEYAEDYILFDYQITNIDSVLISNMYIGFYVQGDIYHEMQGWTVEDIREDHVTGFLQTAKAPPGSCREVDTVNMAWVADNDGDPKNGAWDYQSPLGVVGLRVLRTPDGKKDVNYNWWHSLRNNTPTAVIDWGPRRRSEQWEYAYGQGFPTGDLNKYFTMKQPGFDYDQMFTAVSHVSDGFWPPPNNAAEIAHGGWTTDYLVSFGPYNVEPGRTVPVTIAYVAGENFHVGPNDYINYYHAGNPQPYYDHLDFSDLTENARRAYGVFDNPGVDTDGDGDAGRYFWRCRCGGDTLICFEESETPPAELAGCCNKEYFTGDSVPDFRVQVAPPPPYLKVIPEFGRVTLRWNGQESENYVDFLTQEKNFEGYRVYYGEANRLSDFSLLCSYDLNDFDVYQFSEGLILWDKINVAIMRDSLKRLYGSSFDPGEYYDGEHYFTDPVTGNYLYFHPHEWNKSDLSDSTRIHKVYPSARRDNYGDVTGDGRQRYYEYEYHIPNLAPSKSYYFTVTAFNYGSMKSSLDPMESSLLANAIQEYPLPSSDVVEENGLGVIVWPNPYRINAGYAQVGYENRKRDHGEEWSRKIHFANLPRVCKIRIYTVSGDLVQTIDHYNPEGGPGSQEETWNVISRNTQIAVTGIYIWHVKSDMGEQLGKLVIIK